jgi:hypothetical protein
MRGRILWLAAILVAASAGATPAGAAGPGNPRNERLLAMTEAQQARALGGGLHGQGCIGDAAFPMGVTASGRAKGYAYWSVHCKNGKSYVVQIPPNSKAPIIAEDCKVLEGTGRECFKKF